MKHRLKILTALLVFGGSAQAVTWAETQKGIVDSLKSFEFTPSMLQNPGTILDGLKDKVFIGLTSPLWKNVVNDGVKMVGLDQGTTQKMSFMFEKFNDSSLQKIFDDSSKAFKLAEANPSDTTKLQNLGTVMTNSFKKLQSFMEKGNESIKTSKTDGIGLNIASGNFVGTKMDIAAKNVDTGLNTASASEIAKKASLDQGLQKLGKTVETAASTLKTNSENAVSTRDVAQNLSTAFASYMMQAQYGTAKIEERLNGLLQQGALNNQQVGKLVAQIYKEEEIANKAAYEDATKYRAESEQQINAFKQQVKATAAAIGYAGNAAKDLRNAATLNSGSQGTTPAGGIEIPVPRPRSTVIPPTNTKGAPATRAPATQTPANSNPGSPANSNPENPVEIDVPLPNTDSVYTPPGAGDIALNTLPTKP